MARRSRKSKRRLNSMFLSLLLTALLLIMSTYAWFTQNRQVSIDTITAKVSAAEGLQISLDATTWNTSITVDAASLAAAGQVSAAAQTNAGKLSWPKDLEPVSTIGEVASADVVFQKGRYVSGTALESIANSPLSSEDYIAFDIYLKNSSSQTNGDPLQLDAGSSVVEYNTEADKITGLQYSPRVGFLLYDQVADFTAQASAIKALTSTSASSSKFSIWEPNATGHIGEVVTNNEEVTANTANATYGLTASSTSTTKVEGIVTTTAAVTGKSALQNTVQTTDASLGSARNLTTTAYSSSGTEDEKKAATLYLAKNKIMKMRVYIWLEGQDPDCIDTASAGVSFDTTIKFCKPEVTGSGSGSGSGTGG